MLKIRAVYTRGFFIELLTVHRLLRHKLSDPYLQYRQLPDVSSGGQLTMSWRDSCQRALIDWWCVVLILYFSFVTITTTTVFLFENKCALISEWSKIVKFQGWTCYTSRRVSCTRSLKVSLSLSLCYLQIICGKNSPLNSYTERRGKEEAHEFLNKWWQT